MPLSPIALAVFLLGLSLPFIILAYAAIDTARWERSKVEVEVESQSPQ